jgi:hypothetical protein
MNRACFINTTELASSTQLNLHEQKIYASCIRPIKNNFVRMKTLFFIFFAFVLSTNAFCNDTTYYSKLRTSINQANIAYTSDNYQQLVNCCSRILSVYKSDWLPYYYEAYAYINISFIEKNSDKKEKYCNEVQTLLDSAFKLEINESELYVLQSLLYTARMAISPMVNGPIYLPKAFSALTEAEKRNPHNPRIYYLRAKSTYYTPKFFGGGKEVALPIFEKALQMFLAFKPAGTLYPDWGKGDTERLIRKCKDEVEK